MNLIRQLEAYLMSGNLRPGDKLPGECGLAAQFGVSRSSMREVLKHFMQLGILDRVKKKGTFLKAPGLDDVGRNLAFQLKMLDCGLEELKNARLTLELALAPDVVAHMTPRLLDELERINGTLAAQTESPEDADRADFDFHLALLGSCGNRLFQIFSQVLALLFDRRYREKFHTPEAIRHSAASHETMLDAIRKRDTALFQELIRRHIEPL